MTSDRNREPTRFRIVTLGSGSVGKTAILKQFFEKKFPEKHKETVEDLYSSLFNVNGTVIRVDVLDTAGNLAFPAMRRLNINTGEAFLLVYSIIDRESLENACSIFDEICENRPKDFQKLPIVFAGNKSDLEQLRQIDSNYLNSRFKQRFNDSISKCNVATVEVSAKAGENVDAIFEKFAQLSGLNLKLSNQTSANQATAAPSKIKLKPPMLRRLSLQTETVTAAAKEPAKAKAIGISSGKAKAGSGDSLLPDIEKRRISFGALHLSSPKRSNKNRRPSAKDASPDEPPNCQVN